MTLPTRFVARPSKARQLLLLAGWLGFCALGTRVAGWLGPPPNPAWAWIGWAITAFFGFCAILTLRRLADHDDQIVIDGSGLYWRQWSSDVIPWSEMTIVREIEVQRRPFLAIHLRDPDRYPSKSVVSRMIRANAAAADFGDITISPMGTDKSFAELKDAIFVYWRPRGSLEPGD